MLPVQTLTATATTLLVLYLAYVRAVRYRHQKEIEALPDPLEAGYKTAHQITKYVNQLEFPFVAVKSLEFGLFRTYGIPTISKTLSATKELTVNVPRRYDDTDLILREIYENEVDDDERATAALRRMNFLHSKYAISNGDYLYTLSVFVCEPLRWIQRFEWREPTKNERHALFVYWREIGIKMGIKNIPETVEGFFKFNEEYEKKYMVYAESNKRVANATVDLFLSVVPPIPGLRAAGDAIVRSLMDQRLLDAFGMSPAPGWLQTIVRSALLLRGFVIRNCFLPRSVKVRRTPEKPVEGSSTLRYCPLFNPYETSYPEGYKIETLGPKRFENDPTLGKIHTRQPDSVVPDNAVPI